MIIRALLTALAVLLAYLGQAWLPGILPASLAGICPNLMLIVTMTIAILRGPKFGMLTGFFCGLLQDVTGGGLIGFFALFYLYAGYLNGLLQEFITEDMLLIPLVVFTADELVYGLYVFVFRFLLKGDRNLMNFAATRLLPEFVVSVVLLVFIYGLILRIDGWLTARERKKEVKFG